MIASVCAAAAVLLVVSGVAKLRSPAPASQLLSALTGMRRRRTIPAVRLIGVGEIVVGALVLATGARAAAVLLAAGYLGFAGVSVRLLRRTDRTSCGCFGSADSPVGAGHLVLNLVAAAAAIGEVARPSGPLAGLLDRGAGVATAGLVQVLLLAALGYLAITSLPALLTLRRSLIATSGEVGAPLSEAR